VLDEEADEAFVRAQRRAMDAERGLLRVVAVAVGEAELGGHGEIDLVGGDGEFAAIHPMSFFLARAKARAERLKESVIPPPAIVGAISATHTA